MKWFKHDSDANHDAKLTRVQMKYGMEGYGLYWYCIELIASCINENNLTFELEHDAEIIAHKTGIHYERVQEMMAYMVDLGLFENRNGNIACMKLLKRLDQSMTSNKHMRELISAAKENHDSIMTLPDFVMQEESRGDKKRIKPPTEGADAPSIRDRVWDLGPKVLGNAKQDRSFLGRLIKNHGEGTVLAALEATRDHGTGDPKSYVSGILREQSAPEATGFGAFDD